MLRLVVSISMELRLIFTKSREYSTLVVHKRPILTCSPGDGNDWCVGQELMWILVAFCTERKTPGSNRHQGCHSGSSKNVPTGNYDRERPSRDIQRLLSIYGSRCQPQQTTSRNISTHRA